MRTPPPAVPGMAHANSIPPRPAARARWRADGVRCAAAGDEPRRRRSRPRRARRRVGRRGRRRQSPPRARSTRAQRRTRGSLDSRAQASMLLELGEPSRAARSRRRAADADGRQPRERNVAARARAGTSRLGMSCHALSTLPSPTRTQFRRYAHLGGRARKRPGGRKESSAPARGESSAERRRG